jgi:hypothetical protein
MILSWAMLSFAVGLYVSVTVYFVATGVSLLVILPTAITFFVWLVVTIRF